MAVIIFVAMLLGIFVGCMIFKSYPDKRAAAEIAGYISIVSDIFLRLIKMLIGPLVFSTLVVEIARTGDAKSMGRISGRSMAWFVVAATLGQFNIPEAGLWLIFGVDIFLYMGRSATNAVGNAIASAVVAKSEGALLSEEDAIVRCVG